MESIFNWSGAVPIYSLQVVCFCEYFPTSAAWEGFAVFVCFPSGSDSFESRVNEPGYARMCVATQTMKTIYLNIDNLFMYRPVYIPVVTVYYVVGMKGVGVYVLSQVIREKVLCSRDHFGGFYRMEKSSVC